MNTVQDIFNQFFPSFEMNRKLACEQVKASRDIMHCRTKELGGRLYKCEKCGYSKTVYKSCKNRNCTLCQGVKRLVWADQRTKDVINAPYFHIVFTIPEELELLVYQNQRLLYNLMFKAASETLLELCGDRKYLGAQPGFITVLHTWAQDLSYHPHIHVVLLAGGLTEINRWVGSQNKFFIPVKVLVKKFQGKFLYYLEQYYYRNMVNFYGSMQKHQNPQCFKELISKCYKKSWYAYIKKTFSGPVAVINYLAGYTHRIAISNNRITSIDKKKVTFTTKDRKNNNATKEIALDGPEFIRRFLMHVLPTGFPKIRYYGIVANRNKKTKLELCRQLTNSPRYKPKYEGLSAIEILNALLGKNIMICPACNQAKLKNVQTLYAGQSP